MKKMLFELDKIKLAYDADAKNKNRLLNPLTKKQREILENLGIEEEVFQKLKFE